MSTLYAAYFASNTRERPVLEEQLKDELDAIVKLRNYIAPASNESHIKPEVFNSLQNLHRNVLATLSLMIDAYWSSPESHLLIENEPVLRQAHRLIPQAIQSLQDKLCNGDSNNEISSALRDATHDLHDLVVKGIEGKHVETPFYAYLWLSMDMLKQLTKLNDQVHDALYSHHGHQHLLRKTSKKTHEG